MYLLNTLPTKSLKDKTPCEAWYDMKLSMHHLRVFDCICFYQIPQQKRDKLDKRARKRNFCWLQLHHKGVQNL